MHIAILTNEYPPHVYGGAGVHVEYLTRELARLDGLLQVVRRPQGHRPGGAGVRGRDDDDGPVGAAAHRWQMLVMVSRLMPRPAGRRWLAEADSLLSETTAARRGAAIRSYLLSAPRLAAMMWANEARRRARPGPRRPG